MKIGGFLFLLFQLFLHYEIMKNSNFWIGPNFPTLVALSFILLSCNNNDVKRSQTLNKEQTITEENEDKKDNTSLQAVLNAKKEAYEKTADESKKKAYADGIAAARESGIESSALQVGDTAPNFTLSNASGESVELYDYLDKGYVILTWYRGGWCPYCNLTLQYLQRELTEFQKYNANLIALTPELPDSSLSTAEKNELEFEVLSDVGNEVASEYGIVFQLTDEVAGYYNKGFDLNEYNGDQSNELPLAATYVINNNAEIIYAFLDADYRNRAEPSEITEVLKKLAEN